MKFTDEDGTEKISGRDLSKALGYTEMVHKHLSICIRLPYVKDHQDFYEIVNDSNYIYISSFCYSEIIYFKLFCTSKNE